MKKIMKWVFIRIPIIVMIITAMLIGSLKLVERYPDPLRDGFEEYLSKNSGTNATIGSLEKITFFPNIDIRLQDLTMHNKQNAAIIDIEMDSASISAPFWSMLFGGSRLNDISIMNLKSKVGALTPLALTLDSVGIINKEGPEQYGSFLVAVGSYGGKEMLLEAEIDKLDKNYRMPKALSFSLLIGKAELNASLIKNFSGVHLKTAVFSRGKKTASSKDYVLVKSKEYNKNNPLSCLLYHADAKECDVYLEKKDSP